MTLSFAQIDPIFQFLVENHLWNEEFQRREYQNALQYLDFPKQRLTKLFHCTAYTQAKPRLVELGIFWRRLYEFDDRGKISISDCASFLEKHHGWIQAAEGPWDRLFQALKEHPGWGKKTAALFVKAAIQVHRGPTELQFFEDANGASSPLLADRIYLPVDAVITYIFKHLSGRNMGFDAINLFLSQNYTAEELLIWDDLWFWGFFTQRSTSKKRYLEWNPDKFWAQLSSPKSDQKTVANLSRQFIRLLKRQARLPFNKN